MSRGRAVRCLLAAFALAAWSARAQADDVEDARKHYARGLELYEEGADVAALAELLRAYELAPNWKVEYQIAIVELQLHDAAAALTYFERYLAEGKDQIRPQRRREVEGQMRQLRAQVATLEVQAPPGADVFLDDVRVGTAPLGAPLVVNPGASTIRTVKGGVSSETRRVTLVSGDHLSLELTIPEAAPHPAPEPPQTPEPERAVVAPPPIVPPEPPPPEPEGPPPRLWIGWATTGALACGAIATGVEALSANSSLTRAKADGPSSADTLNGLSSRARGYAIASDVMTGATVVAGGVTLYLALHRPARRVPARAGVGVELGAGRVTVVGSF